MKLLAAAFPFVPAELNIAHFASTYVPSDVQCRLLNAVGSEAKLVSATDYHSIQASKDGKTRDMQTCEQHHLVYLKLFDRMHISFDSYITTELPLHKENTLRTFQGLRDIGAVYLADDEDTVCVSCGCSLPYRYRNYDGREVCPYCTTGKFHKVNRKHWFMRLNRPTGLLHDFAQTIKQKDVQNMVFHFAESQLDDWDITRYNLLGIPVPDEEGQSFYIWYDSLVGYNTLAKILNAEPTHLINFIGKNIVYYHSVPWCIISKFLFGEDMMIDISARGFLDFQKTDPSMIGIMELSERFHPDFIRFYLSFKVRDNMSDYFFTEKEFKDTIKYQCCKRLGGLFYNIWELICKRGVVYSSYSEIDVSESEQFIADVMQSIDSNRINEALKKILNHAVCLKKWLHSISNCLSTSPKTAGLILYESALLQCLLSAYMPEISTRYSVFDSWNPQTVLEARNFAFHPFKERKEVVSLDN